jgi:hypothetical protein
VLQFVCQLVDLLLPSRSQPLEPERGMQRILLVRDVPPRDEQSEVTEAIHLGSDLGLRQLELSAQVAQP